MLFSQITDVLFVGVTPASTDYDLLRQLGVRLVINMRAEQSPYPDMHDPPMPVLWLRTYDIPLLPIPLRALQRGVEAALNTIEHGGKVYTHCAAGVHRSVAMAAAILIAQGHPPPEAMRLIKERREIADPDAWHIRWRINRFARTWPNGR